MMDGPTRRGILGATAALGGIGVLGGRGARGQGLDRVVLQTGWLAQAEHGGFYQAVANGIYREHGIDCAVTMGGPQVDANMLLVGGRADFIVSDALTAFNYVRQDLPFVEVAAIFQKDPRVILAHPGMGVASLADLKGRTILVANSSRSSFWPWLRAKYGLSDGQLRPYTFNMGPFMKDPSLTQQGLLTSEPFDMARNGIKPVVLLLADAGFDNYQTTLNTSARMVRDKPDVVQRFVDASILGWASYLRDDPTPANTLIKAANADMDDAKIAYARDAMISSGIVQSGDAQTLGIGAMTDARWHGFYEAMLQAGAVPAGIDITRGYTTRFVNKRVGLA